VLSDWSGDGKGQILRTEVSEPSGMKHLNLVKNLISREDRKNYSSGIERRRQLVA
jgi:hypothetical protein